MDNGRIQKSDKREMIYPVPSWPLLGREANDGEGGGFLPPSEPGTIGTQIDLSIWGIVPKVAPKGLEACGTCSLLKGLGRYGKVYALCFISSLEP